MSWIRNDDVPLPFGGQPVSGDRREAAATCATCHAPPELDELVVVYSDAAMTVEHLNEAGLCLMRCDLCGAETEPFRARLGHGPAGWTKAARLASGRWGTQPDDLCPACADKWPPAQSNSPE